ncbi:MAG: hypothetical protein ACREV5_05450 [Steroidobacter sp.]
MIGLAVRYTNQNNFYDLMLDRQNSVQIRKSVNGSVESLATAPFALALNRTYRLRLEAIGTRLRAFIDGEIVAEAIDSSLHNGAAALTMSRAQGEYDNVIVSTSPHTTYVRDTFLGANSNHLWIFEPVEAWQRQVTFEEAVLRQLHLSGRARAINGRPAADQIITADVRPAAFGAGPDPAGAGLVARYVNRGSHYYAFLSNDNRISLRKRENGAEAELDAAPFAVSRGTNYRMRFEAIGDSLRVYVNGRLLLETEDEAFPRGRYGLITLRTSADFDSFSAVRP